MLVHQRVLKVIGGYWPPSQLDGCKKNSVIYINRFNPQSELSSFHVSRRSNFCILTGLVGLDVFQAMAILEHGETATESRTRGMGTYGNHGCPALCLVYLGIWVSYWKWGLNPQWNSHLETGLSDQQNHWVKRGTLYIFRHTHMWDIYPLVI